MIIKSYQAITAQIRPGIYFVTNYHESKNIMERTSYYLRTIDGHFIRNEQDVFIETFKQFNFPFICGNWNGFFDLLREHGLNQDVYTHSIPYIIYVDHIDEKNVHILSKMIYEINISLQKYYEHIYAIQDYYVYIFLEESLSATPAFVQTVLYNPHPANWRDMYEGDFSTDPRWKVYQIPEHPIIITVV